MFSVPTRGQIMEGLEGFAYTFRIAWTKGPCYNECATGPVEENSAAFVGRVWIWISGELGGAPGSAALWMTLGRSL